MDGEVCEERLVEIRSVGRDVEREIGWEVCWVVLESWKGRSYGGGGGWAENEAEWAGCIAVEPAWVEVSGAGEIALSIGGVVDVEKFEVVGIKEEAAAGCALAGVGIRCAFGEVGGETISFGCAGAGEDEDVVEFKGHRRSTEC